MKASDIIDELKTFYKDGVEYRSLERHLSEADVELWTDLCGWSHRIAFTGQNGIQDFQTADPRDVAQHMMKLQVHFAESLLHVHNVFGCHLDQALPVPP